DHMLELLGRHSLIDLTLAAKGDIHVDYHHTVEDIGLVMGQALDRALGTRKGISRYGWSIVPMDDALSWAAVDLGGRPYLVLQTATRRRKILDFDLGLIRDFLQALVTQGKLNLHILQLYGKDPHHAYESVFKALARAMRMAVTIDPREKGVPSTKGKI
ncbi:MAG TPA: imidazoleglycerol-phosphate dehydratase, partial [Lentisphaerae bacterium]|nr:imidazoleglycerol-phosphate dehydratase [Lentisphaerota bacterium]